MPIIVDTYNVLHVTGVLPPDLAGLETQDLVELLPRTRFAGEAITLVCDGRAPVGPDAVRGSGTIRIRFSGQGITADELIAQLVARSSAPRRLTVVSSDRAVQQAARRRRCVVLSSEAFLGRITEDLAGMDPRVPPIAGSSADRPGPASPARPSAPPPPAGADPAAPGGFDPLLPSDLLREAASLVASFDPSEADAIQSRETEVAGEVEGDSAATTPSGRGSRAAAGPADDGPAPDAPAPATPAPDEAPPVTPAAPLFPLDLLTEAMALESAEDRMRQGRLAEDMARDASQRVRDAARAAEAAARASDTALRAKARAEAAAARDAEVFRAAEAAIDPAEIERVDTLARGGKPADPDELDRTDHGLPADMISDAERMMRDMLDRADD